MMQTLNVNACVSNGGIAIVLRDVVLGEFIVVNW